MHILGIQIDRPFLRIAFLKKNRRDVQIQSLKTVSLTDKGTVKRLYKELGKGKSATGLNSKQFILRSLELKGAPEALLKEVASFQSEATSLLPASEMMTLPVLKKKGKELTEAHLFTVPKEDLKNHLIGFQELGIDPDRVSTYPTALTHFVKWKMPHLKEGIIIDLGSDCWTCASIEQGELKKTYCIEGGTEALLEAFREDRKKPLSIKEIEEAAKQIDLLQLKSHLNPFLSEKILHLRQEIAKTICSFQKNSPVKSLLFTGRIDAFAHFTAYLLEGVKEEIEAECKTPFSLEELKFAIPLGLALEEMHSRPLQLRQEEFFPEKAWKRLGLYGMGFLALSLSLSLLIIGGALQLTKNRRDQMGDTLQSSLNRFDPNFKKSLFVEGRTNEEILQRWFQEVQAHSRDYPYIVQAPKVSEVLAWLVSHPIYKQLKEEKDPIILRDFQYHLVEYPHIGALKTPYLAKVEIDFQVQGALHARKFHEALLKGDELVDSQLEISWEALADSYRTSFFLKNRSPYVP